MANQLLRLWQSVLDCLEGFASGDDASKGAAVTSMGKLLNKMYRMPEQPKAALKRLVQDWQVRWPAHG
jgi:hypothetical protein